MAGYLMQEGKVEVVGCDRVAAIGDVANKIGTYGIAVLGIDLTALRERIFPSSKGTRKKYRICLVERLRPKALEYSIQPLTLPHKI
jgi:hypothetical protein